MGWYPVSEGASCLQYTDVPIRGYEKVPNEDFACLYPNTFGKTYFEWEYKLDWVLNFWTNIMDKYPYAPLVACALYVVAVFGGQAYMKDKPAWGLRKSLAAWNLFLSVFSIIGFFRTMPVVLHNFYYYSLRDNVCEAPFTIVGFGPQTVWGFIFLLSKFAELIDTFFIVVNKKKLMFLHWYHHITVLYNCWHTWTHETPTGLIFCAVNFGVHSIMYFYYFLMAIRCKPKWFNPMVITVAQILQMVVGVFITYQSVSYVGTDGCWANLANIKGTLIMYASYLALFLKFFFERYGIISTPKAKTL